jgi:hypothetical protein
LTVTWRLAGFLMRRRWGIKKEHIYWNQAFHEILWLGWTWGVFFLGGIMSSEWHKQLCVYIYTWCCPMRIGEKFTDLANDFEACALWNPTNVIIANWWILGMGQVLKTLWRSPNWDFGAT